VVKHAQARYDAGAPTRDLRRHVTAGIRQWAEGEGFASDEVKRGLALATETVARLGLDHDAIAALKFDPEKASRQVLESAKAKDSYWGMENHYEVATRGIKETYRALIEHLRARETVLLPAIQAVRGSIDDYVARVEALGRSTQAKLDDLVAALIAAGTVAEVMAYLQSRIADWDVSVWHPGQLAPSALERRLRARTTGRELSPGN
jgi:hypothetical protein